MKVDIWVAYRQFHCQVALLCCWLAPSRIPHPGAGAPSGLPLLELPRLELKLQVSAYTVYLLSAAGREDSFTDLGSCHSRKSHKSLTVKRPVQVVDRCFAMRTGEFSAVALRTWHDAEVERQQPKAHPPPRAKLLPARSLARRSRSFSTGGSSTSNSTSSAMSQ